MNQIPKHPQINASLIKRIWIYQAERFPIFKTALLLAVFSAASISVSAHLGDRELPAISTLTSIWLVTFIIFFQMRACDEWKDLDDDTKYRPERPIPSGLVKLGSVISVAIAGACIAIGFTMSVSTSLLLPLIIVWVWLALMTYEFFAPEWLKVRPLIYLVSHMMIMPLIDLFITAAEWMPHDNYPPNGLWVFLGLSFVNGCVLEIGRKVWAPESERNGVETYSGLWGPTRAACIWLAMCAVAWLLLLGVGVLVDAPLAVAGPGILALLVVYHTARKFVAAPNPKNQKAIDTMAGLWVFSCYCLAGFAPFISDWILS